MSKVKKGRGYVYSIQYHIVWCVKYRRKILTGAVVEKLKEILFKIAMDVARTILRHGVRDVTIMARSGRERLSARKHEIDYAEIDGVKFEYYKAPVEINAGGVVYNETALTNEGIVLVEGSRGLLEASAVGVCALPRWLRTVIASSGTKTKLVTRTVILSVTRTVILSVTRTKTKLVTRTQMKFPLKYH